MNFRLSDTLAVPRPGPLAFLSLQHPDRHGVPNAPTNEDRIRAYRNLLPVLPGNNYEWRFRNAHLDQAAA